MGLNNWILPALGFITLVLSIKELWKEKKFSSRIIVELLIGVCVLFFSIKENYEIGENAKKTTNNFNTLSIKNDSLSNKIDTLLASSQTFQKYLKDSFGIIKQGDKPVVYDTKVYLLKGKETQLASIPQSENIADISDAAAEMRAYKFSGRNRLRSYFINPKNKIDSLVAKRLYDQISIDFNKTINDQMLTEGKDYLKKFDSVYIKTLRSGQLPKDPVIRTEISNIIRFVNGEEYDLYQCLGGIWQLRKLTNINFQIIDIEGVNRWYKNLKK